MIANQRDFLSLKKQERSSVEMVRYLHIFIFCFCLSVLSSYSQELPTTDSLTEKQYYTDYSDLLTLKSYLLFKLNTLAITDNQDNLLLSPNSPLAIGLGFNFKFGGFALGIGFPKSSKNTERYGKTKRLDLQINLFMKNIGLDGYLQLYKGYYLKNPNDFMDWTESYKPTLPGMNTISIGAAGYYVLNNKRYSNKAAVMRTQKQDRSAGSFLFGIFINYDEVNSPNGFFPGELPDSIAPDFDLKGFRYIATGVTIGYAYTWVISKNLFLNVSAIPGGGYKHILVVNNAGISNIEKQAHAQLQLRGALGYERKHFFIGISAAILIRNIEYKSYEIDLATEQIRLFIGWRFNVRK